MQQLKICPICGTTLTKTQRLRSHVKREHKMTIEDWVLQNVYHNIIPKCACGCGCEVKWCFEKCDFSKLVQYHCSKYFTLF